jgi:hypothetical protein
VAFQSTVRTVRSKDISEALPINIGNPSLVSETWTNTGIAYDCAIGGLPFFYAISNDRPYQRQTAPYRKEQFDNSKEPGEQSLTGWWIRSQSSFHRGAGINFYDPSAGEEVDYRFTNSLGVDVWEKGQVTLLKNVDQTHQMIGTLAANRRPYQLARSIKWGGIATINNKALTTNVATLTTAAVHYYSAGDTVNISGVDSTFNGIFTITSIPSTTTFTYALVATDVASVAVLPTGLANITSEIDGVLNHDEFDVDKLYPTITASVSNKQLTSNVATLTTSSAHGLKLGMEIVVTGVDATFNGTYDITSVPTPTTFTYAKTASNVASTAVSPVGSVYSNVTHFIDYNTGLDDRVYAICDDGITAYWMTNVIVGSAYRLTLYKKNLNVSSTVAATQMFQVTGQSVTSGVMEYVKDRIIACVDNKIYELATNASALPSPIFTAANTNQVFTSIAASGTSIYVAGFNGIQSNILKFSLTTAGAITTLTGGSIAAEFPPGELVYRVYYYLGYIMIGTNKGVRVAAVESDGSLTYGPLIVETDQPVYDFAARDRFVWCATGVAGNPGLTRIDLSEQINPLRFAYANDIFYNGGVTGHSTTCCAFVGTTDRIFFATAAGSVGYGYIQSATEYISEGFLQTGFIRYGTLEPKNFKRVRARGTYDTGGMLISTVKSTGTVYDTAVYNTTYGTPEVNIENPAGSQEYIGLKFTLSKYEEPGDTTSTLDSTGPTFKGYQLRSLPATPRSHFIELPLLCFDIETDRYNAHTGYDGRAWERIQLIEDIDSAGDEIVFQDFTTGEQINAIVEQVKFVRATPPSGEYSGFGGYLTVLIRETS